MNTTCIKCTYVHRETYKILRIIVNYIIIGIWLVEGNCLKYGNLNTHTHTNSRTLKQSHVNKRTPVMTLFHFTVSVVNVPNWMCIDNKVMLLSESVVTLLSLTSNLWQLMKHWRLKTSAVTFVCSHVCVHIIALQSGKTPREKTKYRCFDRLWVYVRSLCKAETTTAAIWRCSPLEPQTGPWRWWWRGKEA